VIYFLRNASRANVVIVVELYPEETITHKDHEPATRPMRMQVKMCDQPDKWSLVMS